MLLNNISRVFGSSCLQSGSGHLLKVLTLRRVSTVKRGEISPRRHISSNTEMADGNIMFFLGTSR